MQQQHLWVAAIALTLGSAQALADTRPSALQYPYGGASFVYEFDDSRRNSDNGYGFQLHFGLPVKGFDRLDLELGYSALTRDRDIDGRSDYTRAFHADVLHRYDAFKIGAGDHRFSSPNILPFGLAGLALVEEDASGNDSFHLGVNLGGGALFDVGLPYGTLLRSEARALYQRNDRTIPGRSHILDFRLMLGFQLPIPGFAPKGEVLPPPAPPRCAVAVVDPVTGRTDCDVDSDGDGVFDSIDQCPGTPPGTVVDATGCPVDLAPQVIRGVNFEFDSATLTNDSRSILDDTAIAFMGMNDPNLQVEIAGHTDQRGSDDYNLKLSQARAESVRQYLIGKGVAPEQLIARGYGASIPVAGNDTEEGRAQNRRVEFQIKLR